MSTALMRLDEAARTLSTIRDIPELMEIRDKAEAVRRYYKAAGDGLKAQNEAARVKAMAERQVGRLLSEMQSAEQIHAGGRPPKTGPVVGPVFTLDELGLTKNQSSRFQRQASLNDDDFAALVAECNEKGVELTQKRVIAAATGAHVGHNSGQDEWYTPERFVTAAREVMGGIDLDPASSEEANAVVRADRFYSEDDDGLSKEWAGRVWMNPPFRQPDISQFMSKMAESVTDGAVTQACVIVNNATETKWFQSLSSVASAMCLVAGRVRFWYPERESASPLQGQVVLYCGKRVQQFRERFAEFGQTWRS